MKMVPPVCLIVAGSWVVVSGWGCGLGGPPSSRTVVIVVVEVDGGAGDGSVWVAELVVVGGVVCVAVLVVGGWRWARSAIGLALEGVLKVPDSGAEVRLDLAGVGKLLLEC